MKASFSIALTMPTDWDRIGAAHQTVHHAVTARFGSHRQLADALAMAAAELLENAVKYASPETDVSLSVSEQDGQVIIAVENDVDPGSPHPERLDRSVRWIAGFDDPAEAYRETLTRVFSEGREDDTEESGLGLVRVAFEARSRIDSVRVETQRVRVRARCAIRRAGGEVTPELPPLEERAR